jgi:hypothetical protein
MARKKITQVTAKEIEGIINNSVQSAKNRLVGSAAEQKKMFVRPIANTDGSPSVAKLVQRLASETEGVVEQLEHELNDLSEKIIPPPPADSIPLSGVFLSYNAEEESIIIVGETGVTPENVGEVVNNKIGALVGDINGALDEILGV